MIQESNRFIRSAAFVLIFLSVVSLCTKCQGTTSASDDQLPPIRTEVKYQEDTEKKNDDPNKAWEEWGETPETRKNPFPKRQRKIEEGMNIHTIMGMAMRQPKVVTAVLSKQFNNENIGQMVVSKFRNQMANAGIGCKLWFVLQGRQVIANCETIADGHLAKEYLVKQSEIIRTVIDNVAFSPKPQVDDDDDDDDDDDEEEQKTSTGKKTADEMNNTEENELIEKDKSEL